MVKFCAKVKQKLILWYFLMKILEMKFKFGEVLIHIVA